MLKDKGSLPMKTLLGAMLALSAAVLIVSQAPAADPVKVSLSAIGRPPIFSNTYVDVAEAMGYWKSAGADVNVRWFQRGSDTGKAVRHRRRAGRHDIVAGGDQPDRVGRAGGGDRRHELAGLGGRVRRSGR